MAVWFIPLLGTFAAATLGLTVLGGIITGIIGGIVYYYEGSIEITEVSKGIRNTAVFLIDENEMCLKFSEKDDYDCEQIQVGKYEGKIIYAQHVAQVIHLDIKNWNLINKHCVVFSALRLRCGVFILKVFHCVLVWTGSSFLKNTLDFSALL